MTPQDFQSKWLQFTASVQFAETISSTAVASMARNAHQDFCAHMKQNNFFAMASGGDTSAYKSVLSI